MRDSKFKIRTECRLPGHGHAVPSSASSSDRVCRLAFCISLLAVLALTAGVRAQELGQYRDFRLGASLASVSALTGAPITGVTLIHERPALMQELRWIPSYSATVQESRARGDAVQLIVFSFYEDQLSRLMIDYDRTRTVGLTDGDMIEALSEVYGEPLAAKTSGTLDGERNDESVATRRVAQWVDAGYTVTLSRWAYGAAFRLNVESTRLGALARTADARALVLDAREAPQREAARLKQDAQDKRDAQEKARTANKTTFQP